MRPGNGGAASIFSLAVIVMLGGTGAAIDDVRLTGEKTINAAAMKDMLATAFGMGTVRLTN